MQSEFGNPRVNGARFNPLLFAGLLSRPLPARPVNFALEKICTRLARNHPQVLERLEPIFGQVFIISPQEFDRVFQVRFHGDGIDAIYTKTPCEEADVMICGPLMSLIDMLDGKQDGDALFFNRLITVEGNTESLLTLRNALDSDDIDLMAEITATFGPLKKISRRVLEKGRSAYHTAEQDMEVVNTALLNPLLKRVASLEQENLALKSRLKGAEKNLERLQRRLSSLDKKTRGLKS